MHVHLDKADQIRETVSKEGSGTDEEPIDTRVSKVTGKFKGGHHGRISIGNTRQVQDILHYYGLVQMEKKKSEAQ